MNGEQRETHRGEQMTRTRKQQTMGLHARTVGVLVILAAFAGASRLAAQGIGPRGATAKCQDGAYVHNRSQAEACRDHDGLAVWYGLAKEGTTAATARRGDPLLNLEDALTRE